MSAANRRPPDHGTHDPDPSAPGGARSAGPEGGRPSGEYYAVTAFVSSAMRPAPLPSFGPPPQETARRDVLPRVAQALDAIEPDATEAVVAEAFVAALVDLLPERLIAVRVVDELDLSGAAAVASAPLQPAGGAVLSFGEGARTCVMDGAVDGVDVHATARGVLLAVISVERRALEGEHARDAEVAGAVAPFLANALRTARAGRDRRAQLARLGSAVDGASEAIALIDRLGRVALWNNTLGGFARDGRVERGAPLATLFDGASRTAVLDVTARALQGETTRCEIDLVTAEAPEGRVVAFVASPVRNERGQIDAALLVGRDITDVRTLETRIVRADKLATLGQFAASVVHEVNNPVAAILMYTEHLARTLSADAADMARLQRIGEAAARIQTLARQLLSYARPGGEPAAAIAISEVVEQALLFCEPVLAETGTTVERALEAEVPAVRGVRGELTQVLVNLVTNACHAVPRGRGRVVLGARVAREGWVRVSIEDNGHGIAPAHLPRIFEPFFTTRGAGRGTGLGLSIVRSILDSHGATLRVAFSGEEGTRFELELPVFTPEPPRHRTPFPGAK